MSDSNKGASLRDRAGRLSARAVLRRLRHPAAIACAYAGIAIFTFGYSASTPHQCFDNFTGQVGSWCPFTVIGPQSFFAGLFWPLYWSWELQS